MNTLPSNVYRERIDFSKIRTTIPIPNLIEIQRKSYERFLQMNRLPAEREDAGLQSVFKSVFPISDFRENSSLRVHRVLDRELGVQVRPVGRVASPAPAVREPVGRPWCPIRTGSIKCCAPAAGTPTTPAVTCATCVGTPWR